MAYQAKQAEEERAARWRQLAEQQREERERRETELERQREREERRARRVRLTQEHLARTGQIPQPEPAQDAPEPGFVISDRLREWRLAQEAKRAAEAATPDVDG